MTPELRVMAERCAGCPFGPTPCVSRESAKAYLAQCDADDNHFVCHEHVIAETGPVTCAGFYLTGRRPLVFRVARALGIPVVFVGAPEHG